MFFLIEWLLWVHAAPVRTAPLMEAGECKANVAADVCVFVVRLNSAEYGPLFLHVTLGSSLTARIRIQIEILGA